jgi:hypothetical protein
MIKPVIKNIIKPVIGSLIGDSSSRAWTPLYVSNSGNDANSGKSPALAVTPTYLSTLTLTKGLRIFFNKGETYNNFTLNVPVDNVVIDSYGTGANPIIAGSSVIATGDWTADGGGIYHLTKAGVKWVYFDDTFMEISKTTLKAVASLPQANQILVSSTDKTYFSQFTSLVGCKLRIFEDYNFRMSFEYTINAYDKGTGVFTLDRVITTCTGGAGPNYFFVYNNTEVWLATREKWAYVGTTLKINTLTTIASHTICAGLQDVGINVTGDNCLIQNITFKHYQKSGIKSYNKTTSVLHCTGHDIRGSAIYAYGNSGHLIADYNTLYNCGSAGIRLGAVAKAHNYVNNIYNIGTGIDCGWPQTDAFLNKVGWPSLSIYGTTDDVSQINGCGIIGEFDWTSNYSLPDSIDSQFNIIHDTAGYGIKVVGNNHIMDNNIVYNFMGLWCDGAGLNTYAGVPGTFPDTSCDNISMKHNIIHDRLKIVQWSLMPDSLKMGIYLDNNSSNVDIDGNTIYTSDGNTKGYCAIYHNVTRNIKIHNNVTKNYGTTEIDTFYSTNVELHDNIIYGVNATTLRIGATTFTGGGYANNNTYINPNYIDIFAVDTTKYNFANWKTAVSQDAGSTNLANYIPAGFNQGADAALYTNETNAQVVTPIFAGFKNIAGTPISTVTLPAYSSQLVLKDYTANILPLVDGFSGASIDYGNWDILNPNSWFTQTSGKLHIALAHSGIITWFINKLTSFSKITTGVAVAQGKITWTTDSAQEAIGGIYLWKDANNWATIGSRGNGKVTIYITIGGTLVVGDVTTIAKNNDFKIWTDGTTIKFYYWNVNTWTQINSNYVRTLGYDLRLVLTASDNAIFTGANPIDIDDVYFTNVDYATHYPV